MTEVEAPALLADERQQHLVDLLARDGCERQFLNEALEAWREAIGAEALAAYLPAERGFECCARVGDASFPESFEDAAATGFAHRSVAHGLLLATGGDLGAPVPRPLPLLLAAGLRLCRLGRRLEQQDFYARLRGVELEAFHDVGLAITSTLDLEAVSEEILLRAVSQLDARRGALYLVDGECYRLQRTIGGDALPELALAREEGAAVLPGVRHLLTVPIEIDGRRRGLLAVGDKESRRGVGPFEATDRRSLARFANQAAIALEQARLHREVVEKERLEREIELASQIQRDILPRQQTSLPGYDLLGWTRPARHVGGDYWDVVPRSDGRLALAVGDVSGKGVPAALLVSTLHSALRLLLDRSVAAAEVVCSLNGHFVDFSAANKFVTLFLAEVEPGSGRVGYVNAGHNPALLVRAAGAVEPLPACGLPLGLFPAAGYEAASVGLEAGDLLCIYSDGVTEASSRNDEELGSERFADLLVAGRELSLAALGERIEETLAAFTEGAPQGDDQTVVMLRRMVASAQD